MRVLQPPATLRTTLILPYKEEVAGSNPASPTYEVPANSGICGYDERAGKRFPALLLQPVLVESYPDLGVVLYGPGDDRLAHQPNECVDVESFARSIRFYEQIAARYFG
jgi:hypothetical protein